MNEQAKCPACNGSGEVKDSRRGWIICPQCWPKGKPPRDAMNSNGIKNNDQSLCLCGCGVKVLTRGLSSAHYRLAYRLIHDGLTTWDKLEKTGRALPPKQAKLRAWFLKSVEKDGET